MFAYRSENMSEATYSTLAEMQQQSCEAHANKPLFGVKEGGAYQWLNYQGFAELVDACRGGLAQLGIGKDDKVAIISDNRIQWAVAAYACYGLGAVYVPMYEKQLPKDWTYILNDCGAKVLIVATNKIADKTKAFPDELEKLEHIINLVGSGEGTWDALIESGKAHPAECGDVGGDDVAGLIYTSGTTGKPKGVVLTHGNITANLRGMRIKFPIDPADRSLSFLPWAHSFGQTCELHGLLSSGGSMGLAESVDKLLLNLGEVKPSLLFSVPRVFNKIYDAIQKQVEASAFKKVIFGIGMRAANERRALAAKGKSPGAWLQFKLNLIDKLAFSKVREKFGGRLRYAFSGGAALSPAVAEFIDNMNIQVYEGYGLTETSPILTANTPEGVLIGSVGKPFPEVTIRIDGADGKANVEGEVMAAGPNIMKGYFNMPEATAEVIEQIDGKRFFRTGDLGKVDDKGFLYITGRVKELYKLENGKYVAPAPLEEGLRLSLFVNQAYIHGMNKPYNVALIVPDADTLTKWAAENGLGGKSLEDLCKDDKVIALIQSELAEAGKGFKGFERPKKVTLVAEEFTPESDLLTPTMKYKRRNIEKRYGDQIQALYK